MDKFFDLLSEPWLPVKLASGKVIELGLREVFVHSGEITALAETSPPNLVAEYRLLLAITHRALTSAFGTWKDKDRALWYRDGLPIPEIVAYLEEWRERFWLFHPEFPFMQVAALAIAEETRDKKKPWTQIALASANGNSPVVFDHSVDIQPISIRPADACSALLGFLQFTPGGLVKVLRDADKAGALANTAAVVPVAPTLSQTLCLCLHPAPTGHGDEDFPSWEQAPLSIEQLRGDPVLASGPNDRYTRQSRAVLFLRSEDGNVQWLHFAAGLALGEDTGAPDPMASFRAGSNGLVRLNFAQGRALWRDLPALVPNPQGDSQPAAVVNYAINLRRESSVGAVYQPILMAGLTSDQAKLLRWRVEQVMLPASLLFDVDKAQSLRQMVRQAEELFIELRRLAARMVAEALPDPGSKDTRARARDQLESGPLATCFFASAERSLPHIVRLIEADLPDDAAGVWHAALRDGALESWNKVLAGLGRSPSALRADAMFWPRLHGLLNKQVPKQQSSSAQEA